MNVSNLGVCFGPTLLRPEEETVASILDLKFYNIVVEILIDNYERIFFSEPEKMSPKPGQASTVNGPTVSSSNSQSIYSPPNNHLPTYVGSDETVNSGSANRPFINNGHPLRISPNYRSHNQPYTCVSIDKSKREPNFIISLILSFYLKTVTSYVEPPISSSMHSVHEPANGGYAMSRSDHISNRPPSQQRLKNYAASVTSQSETNLPNLRSYSPTSFRTYNRLGNYSFFKYVTQISYSFCSVSEANSTSSSNESLSSTSRENFVGITPKKSERSSVYMSYPKMYKSPGNV